VNSPTRRRFERIPTNRRVLVWALALGAALVWGAPAAGQSTADICDITTTERVVAVGDVHGGHDRFVAILRAAGLLDNRDRWIGGRAFLVQTGDVLDRGPDSRKTLDLLRRLERDAPRDGGRVIVLLGNHEVMRMVGDWRYVSPGEDAAFRTADSADLRERAFEASVVNAEKNARSEKRAFDRDEFRKRFLEQIPVGRIEMNDAFSPEGDYGRWLRTHAAFAKINGIVYVHGGISPKVAALGCAGVNAAVAKDLAVPNPTAQQAVDMFSSSEDGPLWYRGLAEEEEGAFAPTVDQILQTLQARAIVIGHTVQRTFRIVPRFEGRVLPIDTGMLGGEFYKGGRGSALEINGSTFTAIYEDGRQPLNVPALAPAAAAR
jgi:hypothetical protein